ncbi:MAG: PP2C family protein-serine/threonine phosphatase [Isosphaeraceae bacterium]
MSLDPQGARILVVDDDPGILHAVSRILGRRHHVTCVATGPAAIEEAKRLRPDLAIVDIRLPEMTGFEVTKALKTTLRDVDVILMTGNAEEPDDNLIKAIDEGAFYFIQKPFDRRVLLALVNRCLELRRLREEREMFLRRVKRELEEARQFQLSLLPPPHFNLGGISIHAHYKACNELAGDIYDYVEAGDGAVALLIADVVGHGTSAAMMTGVVKAAFRASHVDRFEPRAVVERVREGIRDFDASRFVTLCCARVNSGRRELTYVNAGHPEPIARTSSAQPILLAPTGPLLTSALSDLPYEQVTVELGPGDSLLLYTDGVTEAHGATGLFGQERLVSSMMRRDRRGKDLLDGLLSEVAAFSGSSTYQDDITLLTLDLDGTSGS